MNPLDFVDYIFDRYAYLGVDPTASDESLRQEIRRRRAQNHPDKLHNVSDEILRLAEETLSLLDQCERVLLTEGLRAAYDERLAQFKEATPHLVSTSGVPILDPSRHRLDLEYLLGNETLDLSALEAYALTLSGHDDKRLARAQSRFDKHPDDLDYREDLRDALTKQLVYLCALEDFYWQRAGVHGATADDADHLAHRPDALLDVMATRLERAQGELATAIGHRSGLAALGFTPVLRLTFEGSGDNGSHDDRALAEHAARNLEVRAQDLKTLVERKKAVVEALTRVSRWRHLRRNAHSHFVDIVLVRSEAPFDEAWPGPDVMPLGMVLRLDRQAAQASLVKLAVTAAEFESWPHELVVLEPHAEIPSKVLEAVAVLDLLTADAPTDANPPPAGQVQS